VYEIRSVLCIYSVAICIVYRTEEKVNHVLLFTVLNPVYPITVVSMSAIWSFTPKTCSVSHSTLYVLLTIDVNGFCVHNMLPSWFRKPSWTVPIRIKIFGPYATLFFPLPKKLMWWEILYLKFTAWGPQIPAARSLWQLDFVWLRPIFVGTLVACSPSGAYNFEVTHRSLGNLYTPGLQC